MGSHLGNLSFRTSIYTHIMYCRTIYVLCIGIINKLFKLLIDFEMFGFHITYIMIIDYLIFLILNI